MTPTREEHAEAEMLRPARAGEPGVTLSPPVAIPSWARSGDLIYTDGPKAGVLIDHHARPVDWHGRRARPCWFGSYATMACAIMSGQISCPSEVSVRPIPGRLEPRAEVGWLGYAVFLALLAAAATWPIWK